MKQPCPGTEKGLLVSVEGIDGAGKTELVEALRRHLLLEDLPTIVTREPGGTWLGEKLREVLKDPKGDFSLHAEFFLFQAARTDHYQHVIAPALMEGKVVLVDRFIDSTTAYQYDAFDLGYLMESNARAIGHRFPDLTILLDLDPLVAIARLDRDKRLDRIEARGVGYLTKCRGRFLTQANLWRDRVRVVKAGRPREVVVGEAVGHLQDALVKKFKG